MDFQIIQKLFDTFFDKSRSLISRLFIFLSFCFFLILVDDYFKFSYNFKINSQIEQIAQIENIIKENKDSSLVVELKEIERTIIDTRTKSDYLTSLFSSLYDAISRHSENAARNISSSPILHYLTSNWLLIYFVFWMLQGLRRFILTVIIWWILAAGMLLVIFFWLNGILTAAIIPSDINPYLKLLLNVLIQGVFGLAFYAIVTIYGKSAAKKKEYKNKEMNKTEIDITPKPDAEKKEPTPTNQEAKENPPNPE